MHRALLITLVVMTVNALSSDTLLRLRRTKELNFTFFYEHFYPEPEALEITLEFLKSTSNLTQGLETLSSALNVISEIGKRYNATLVLDPPQEPEIEEVNIHVAKEYRIMSYIVMSVAPEVTALDGLLGELMQLNSNLNTKLVYIEWSAPKILDPIAEQAQALASATKRGKEICEKYLNMKLKKVQVFEKYREKLQGNSTDEEETSFVGDYVDVVMELQEQELQEEAIDVNQIYRCQVTCQNNIQFASNTPPQKKISPKLAQQKGNKKPAAAQQKPKSTKTSSKPLKKGKSIDPAKYQKNNQDQL